MLVRFCLLFCQIRFGAAYIKTCNLFQVDVSLYFNVYDDYLSKLALRAIELKVEHCFDGGLIPARLWRSSEIKNNKVNKDFRKAVTKSNSYIFKTEN